MLKSAQTPPPQHSFLPYNQFSPREDLVPLGQEKTSDLELRSVGPTLPQNTLRKSLSGLFGASVTLGSCSLSTVISLVAGSFQRAIKSLIQKALICGSTSVPPVKMSQTWCKACPQHVFAHVETALVHSAPALIQCQAPM